MRDPLKVVEDFGLSTDSQMRMVLQIKNNAPYTTWKQSDFEKALHDITGVSVKCETRQESKYLLMYVIQDYIILTKKGHVAEAEDVVKHAWSMWTKFKSENAISLSLEEDYVPVGEEATKTRKGSKSEKAYQIYCEFVNEEDGRKKIIEAFKNELDMSPGGATTYFHNMKKRYNQEHS